MLANKSIRYLRREEICENGEVVTIRELRDFLDRLLGDKNCGSYKVMVESKESISKGLAYYVLSGHDCSLKLLS